MSSVLGPNPNPRPARKTTEAKTQRTKGLDIKAERRYRPPRGGRSGRTSRERARESPAGTVLPAPLESRGNRPLPDRRYDNSYSQTNAGGATAASDSRATTCLSSAGPDQRVMEERREGQRVETPASADRQAALPRRKIDPGRLMHTVPAGHEGRKDGHANPPGRKRASGGGKMKLSYGPKAREHVARGWARMYTYLSFVSFFCFSFFFSLSFGGIWGGGGRYGRGQDVYIS